jgi:predicted CoA-binding protein
MEKKIPLYYLVKNRIKDAGEIMQTLKEKVNDFLSQKRIAVAGVSRNPEKGAAANAIYNKLKDSGYQVYPVNPQADSVEGDTCYPNLKAIPDVVDGVVIVTPPDAVGDVVKQCIQTGVSRVWMHRSFGTGSVSAEASKLCAENNISVIAGACPMMYVQPVDFGHKVIKGILRFTGGLPK